MGGDFWLMGFDLGFVIGMESRKMCDHVIVLCSDGGWAPPFCQKLELKSERYNSVLEPNTNCREI